MRDLLFWTVIFVGLLFHPFFAYAAAAVAVAGPTIDLTGIATAVIAGIFAVLGIVIPLLVNGRVKNQAAAATLNTAIGNSLGALQQAADGAVNAAQIKVPIPGVAGSLTPAVQYVLDQAGPEMKRLGITPTAVAAKIDARLGLVKIAAVAAPAVLNPVTLLKGV